MPKKKVIVKEEVVKEELKQPEISIGLVGHVDHGKCLTPDEVIVLENELTTGEILIEKAQRTGKLIKDNGIEKLYEIKGLKTLAYNENYNLIPAEAFLFTQEYKGKVIEVKTRSGRKIKVSPDHPLLVNDKGNLIWTKASEISPKMIISAVKNFNTKENLTKLDINLLKEDCHIVNYENYIQLINKTNNFKEFEYLNLEDYNKLRILTKKSFYKVEKECNLTRGVLSAQFKKGKLNENLSFKKWIQTQTFQQIKLNEVLINYKKKTQCFASVPLETSEDLMKWLAFILAEGSIGGTRIQVAQKEGQLLSEFKDISKKLFNAEFKKVSEFDYHYSNKALLVYLYKVLGITKDFSVPFCIFSQPHNYQKSFLNWFFSLDANINYHSGQIQLCQNKYQNILVISYLLKNFNIQHKLGIVKKIATNGKMKEKKLYNNLSISGKSNLAKFLCEIGSYSALSSNMELYLKNIKQRADVGEIPINIETIRYLIKNLGIKNIKSKSWFYGYNDSLQDSKFNEENLIKFIDECKLRLQLLKAFSLDKESIRDFCNEAGVSLLQLSKISEISIKRVNYSLNKNGLCLQILKNSLIERNVGIFSECENLIVTLENLTKLKYDEVVVSSPINYEGKLVDLVVPQYHNFIAGYGGLVAHNTTITQRLSGKWTDTHSEEVKRGITIRLGYANATFYKCDKCKEYIITEKCECGGKAVRLRSVSFVDAPGHETLMATMLSGSAIMDAALLLVAADEECPQPQTKEHLMALEICGIKDIIIVQNKIDLVGEEDALKNYKQIKDFIKGTIAENAPIVPISAKNNVNIDLLIETIEETFKTPKRDLNKEPLMFIARSFDINKPGTSYKKLVGGVVGGALKQGILKVGDKVEIRPGRKVEREGKVSWLPILTEIKGIRTGENNLESAQPGASIALLTSLDPSLIKSDSLTGNIVGHVGKLPSVYYEMNLIPKLLDRVVGTDKELKVEPIKKTENLMLNINSATTIGLVTEVSKGSFLVKLKIPVCAEKTDKVTVSRMVGHRFRLIGYCTIK